MEGRSLGCFAAQRKSSRPDIVLRSTVVMPPKLSVLFLNSPGAEIGDNGGMCRSIKTLRPPVIPEEATEEEIRAAALQYVRKVSGFRAPAAHNREVFDRAVEEIAASTMRLLDGIEVRGAART